MRVVLTGASGQLGAYVLDALVARGHEVDPWSGAGRGDRGSLSLRPVDLTDPAATRAALDACAPEAVLHLAAVSTADGVRNDPERGRAVNVDATARIADWCGRHGCRLVYTSTDLVFPGDRPWWREDDPPGPVLAYGRSKLDGEAPVRDRATGLAARMSLMYGPSRSGRPSVFDRTVDTLARGVPQTFFEDEYRTPLDLPTAADLLARLAERPEVVGVLHVGGPERMSRADLMRRVARGLGLDPGLVLGNRQADVAFPEPRPADVSLDTARLASLFPDVRRPSVEAAAATWARF